MECTGLVGELKEWQNERGRWEREGGYNEEGYGGNGMTQ